MIVYTCGTDDHDYDVSMNDDHNAMWEYKSNGRTVGCTLGTLPTLICVMSYPVTVPAPGTAITCVIIARALETTVVLATTVALALALT